ncbi:MAG TPA: TIGR02281 family clan AA aspartic protease [Pseudomonadales bacterium]|nr:TIGR02281 family clan AA aspartic protease [Pseudomonadales bacterium]
MAKINNAISTASSALASIFLAVYSAGTAAMPDVQVNGLLPNQAVVTINGQQHILKSGKTSPEGVTLMASDSKQATFSWQGQEFNRTLNKDITSNFTPKAARSEVRIERGEQNHFFTPGMINGRQVHFMIDTGATSVAMDMHEADRLGIDWRNGKRFLASTAGGATPSYSVVLKSVTVGDITINNVEGSVIVANMGSEILLGMTFLQQTEMREDNNALVLTKKY